MRGTCTKFLQRISPLNQTLRSQEKKKWSLTKEGFDCYWKQILLVSTSENVRKRAKRIWMLMLGCKGVNRVRKRGNEGINDIINIVVKHKSNVVSFLPLMSYYCGFRISSCSWSVDIHQCICKKWEYTQEN